MPLLLVISMFSTQERYNLSKWGEKMTTILCARWWTGSDTCGGPPDPDCAVGGARDDELAVRGQSLPRSRLTSMSSQRLNGWGRGWGAPVLFVQPAASLTARELGLPPLGGALVEGIDTLDTSPLCPSRVARSSPGQAPGCRSVVIVGWLRIRLYTIK